MTSAEPALQEAGKSDDAEVMRRAKELLDKFKWGIYPSTPKAVVELIGRYQARTGQPTGPARSASCSTPARPGARRVLKIVAAEDDPKAKQAVLGRMALEAARGAAAAAGREGLRHPGNAAGRRHGGRQQDRPEQCRRLLAAARRARPEDRPLQGPGRQGREAPRKRPRSSPTSTGPRATWPLPARPPGVPSRNDLVETVLCRGRRLEGAGPAAGDLRPPAGVEKLGYRAAYNRLAGNAKEFEEALAEIRKLADNPKAREERPAVRRRQGPLRSTSGPRRPWRSCARARVHAPALFEILAAQQKYREALALVESARAALTASGRGRKEACGETLARLEVLQARTLFSLGEKTRPGPSLPAWPGRSRRTATRSRIPTTTTPGSICCSSRRSALGLTDEAFEHAAKVLSLSSDQGWLNRVLGKLFPSRSESAGALWALLKAIFPQDDIPANLKRLRDALAGKVGPKELGPWITHAEAMIKIRKADDAERWWLALAETALACEAGRAGPAVPGEGGQSADPAQAGRPAGRQEGVGAGRPRATTRPGRRIGSSPARCRRPLSQALPLYLSGKALVEAGQAKEGQERMEQAHWLPLGNEMDARLFSDGLARRGQTEAVRREDDLLLLPRARSTSYSAGDALCRIALDAASTTDLLESAEYQERAMLRVMHPLISFVAKSAYVGVPALICRQRASGLLAAGKVEEALPLIALCQDMLPGNVDLAIQVVPALEAAGKKKEADELFRKTIEVYEKLCQEYPTLRLDAQQHRLDLGLLQAQPRRRPGARPEGRRAGAEERRPSRHAGRGLLPARRQGQGDRHAEEGDRDGTETGLLPQAAEAHRGRRPESPSAGRDGRRGGLSGSRRAMAGPSAPRSEWAVHMVRRAVSVQVSVQIAHTHHWVVLCTQATGHFKSPLCLMRRARCGEDRVGWH